MFMELHIESQLKGFEFTSYVFSVLTVNDVELKPY